MRVVCAAVGAPIGSRLSRSLKLSSDDDSDELSSDNNNNTNYNSADKSDYIGAAQVSPALR